MRDERDPTKTYGQLGSHPRQARILKDRWTSFLSRANQIRLKQSPSPAAAATKTANNDADEPRALEGRTEVTEGSLIVRAKNANKGLMVFRDPPPLGTTNNAESYAAAATGQKGSISAISVLTCFSQSISFTSSARISIQ